MPNDCLRHNFQIPRKYIYHGDFNSTLTNFNGQGENIANNSKVIDTNVTSPKNNLNKILDNLQRNIEIKDLTKKSKSNLLGLIKLSKENPNNSNIAYLIINSLREKNISLREICVDETKLHAPYPKAQFHIGGYQHPPFRRDRNKHGAGKMVFVQNSIIVKRFESLEGK